MFGGCIAPEIFSTTAGGTEEGERERERELMRALRGLLFRGGGGGQACRERERESWNLERSKRVQTVVYGERLASPIY